MDSQKISYLKKTGVVSWILFLATLVITIISIIPAIFPALLLRSFGGHEDNIGINPFEIGAWALPLLVTNIILLFIVVAYLKNRLWQPLTKSIKFIFNFEVSKGVSFFVVLILIGFYITFSVGELFNGQHDEDFYEHVKPWLESYSVTDLKTTPLDYHFMLLLETVSMKVFENYKVIPFFASISLLLLTYFVTVEISKKRFAGIVAMVIVLQSTVFLMYDTSVSYPNFWILFYLLSLYLIIKKWPLSPISYVASIFSKPLTAAFLPMTLFFVYNSDISKKKKIYNFISYGVIILAGIGFLTLSNSSPISALEFDSHDFWGGFSAIYFSLRYDVIVLAFLLPLVVGLFIASSKGMPHANSIMFLILGILLSAALVPAFSTIINVPYRYITLIVFFALGTGVLLSKKVT